MISKEILMSLYLADKLSMAQIANNLHCSQNRVAYWMHKYAIPRRTISDAIYQKNNPNGDPFITPIIDSIEKARLFGMGIGLYWGEGTKANIYSVRLGNSDPKLILMFMRFLVELYGVQKPDLRFGLQVFTDIDTEKVLQYWMGSLGVNADQFYKVHVTISGSIGTYRRKSDYGVVTLYYNNKRLRDILVNALPR